MPSRSRNGTVGVLLSGGVDSSVSAALLKREGYAVEGFNFRFDLSSELPGVTTPSQPNAREPEAVAEALQIPLHRIEITQEFLQSVVFPLMEGYRRGRTPNPCVSCNRLIKFKLLIERIRSRGMDLVATGHYARIVRDEQGFHLNRAKDSIKDQSYFIYGIGKENLSRVLFPVGHLQKDETVTLAREMNLPVKQSESQDICFLAGEDYRRVLGGNFSKPGPIVDSSGKVLGEHEGIERFTIGQRKGIGLSGGPYYVIGIEPQKKTVIVGQKRQGYHHTLKASQAVWLEPVNPGDRVEAKVRSRQKASPAVVTEVTPEGFSLQFDHSQWAITPGQSAVLYQGERVLGGGTIDAAGNG